MSAPTVTTRPRIVPVVLWGMLVLSLWNLGQAVALFIQLDGLAELSLTPDPRWRLAMAVIWSMLFGVAAVLLWRRHPRCWPLVPLLLAIYGVYKLVIIIVFSNLPPAMLPALAYVAFGSFSSWAVWKATAGTISHPRQ